MLSTVNTTQATLTAGATVPLGANAIRTNNDASLNDNAIEIQRAGTFEALATIIYTATAAGDVTAQMLANGTAVPGATATVTATQGQTVTLTVQGTIQTRTASPGTRVPITWTISAAGTLVSNVASVKRVI